MSWSLWINRVLYDHWLALSRLITWPLLKFVLCTNGSCDSAGAGETVYAAPHSARRDVYVSSWDQMWRWAVQHLYNHAEPTSATWWLTFGKTHARCQKRHLESTLKIQGTKEIAQHTQMHHRAEIHTCCHIYIRFTVDFLLNAELWQISPHFSPQVVISSLTSSQV